MPGANVKDAGYGQRTWMGDAWFSRHRSAHGTRKERLVNGSMIRGGLVAALAATAALAFQTSPAAAKVQPLCADASPLDLPQTYSAPALTSAQSHYLRLAQLGVRAASGESTWGNQDYAWYNALLTGNSDNPLAQVWD